jgi:hypothetical protein
VDPAKKAAGEFVCMFCKTENIISERKKNMTGINKNKKRRKR